MSKGLIDILLDNIFDANWTGRRGERLTERELSCPRCGGQLVLRVAKKGANAGKSFYGCSNYPKCRYIHD